MSLAELTTADWERRLADWGEPAIYRRILFEYDPASQQREDSITDTPVTVITSGDSEQPPADGAGLDRYRERWFLLLASALPHEPVAGDRLVLNDVVYEIRRVLAVPQAPVVQLQAAAIPA